MRIFGSSAGVAFACRPFWQLCSISFVRMDMGQYSFNLGVQKNGRACGFLDVDFLDENFGLFWRGEWFLGVEGI